MKGTVKFYNDGKHFGFITGEDGKDYFVHSSGLNEGVTLSENAKVTFDLVDGDRGKKAGNVSIDNE
ncbi:MAG: cold shock domain-containing protein [Candidatus Woesearchaeota archaeon]|jgi:CspA family cold shock protein|nr:cold shock domain-containing protein [Candidatus Woesearchaeota archaeon]